jgi:tetratricopeptide (TPR) repeat protein
VPSLAEALRRHSTHYLAVLRSANELYEQGGKALNRALASFDVERSNIQVGFTYCENHSADDRNIASLCCAYPIAGFYLLNLRLSPQERLHWFKTGYSAARCLKERSAEGTHLGNIGMAYMDLGRTDDALKNLKKFLRISRAIGHLKNQAIALGLLGLTYQNLDDYKKAAKFFKEEMILALKMKDRRAEGVALNHLGLIHALSGKPRLAIETWKQDLQISREIGDKLGEGTTLGNLGIACAGLGHTNRALSFYRQHVRIARKLGDERGEARSLWNMSRLLAERGDKTEAISVGEAALGIYNRIDIPRSEEVKNYIEHWRRGYRQWSWSGSF